MKKRTIEAEKIEKDYMLRLKKSIAQYNAIEAAEIEQDVIEHIEEAVNESGDGEVSLTEMANVLEKLGAPEIYATEVGDSNNLKTNTKKQQGKTNASPGKQALSGSKEDIPEYSKLLDKIWLGSLISIIGLFIPIIDLSICSIIGAFIIGFAVMSYKGKYSAGIWSVSVLSLIEALLLICISLLNTIGLFVPFISILQLIVVLPLLIISFIIYWRILSHCATVLEIYNLYPVAESVRTKRNIGLILSIVMVFVAFVVGLGVGFLGVAISREVGHSALATAILADVTICIMLPVFWLLGWFFTLRPLTEARKALNTIS